MAEIPNSTRGKHDKFELTIYGWRNDLILRKFFVRDENAIAWTLIMWLPKYVGRRTELRILLLDLATNKIIWSCGRIEDED